MKYTVTMTDADGTKWSGTDDRLSDALTELLLCVDEYGPPHFHRLLLDELEAWKTAVELVHNPPCGHKLELVP